MKPTVKAEPILAGSPELPSLEGFHADAIRKPLANAPETITLEKSYRHDTDDTKGEHRTVERTVTLHKQPERLSHEKHDAPFRELPDALKESVRFAVSRKGIKSLTLPTFARLDRYPREQVSDARS